MNHNFLRSVLLTAILLMVFVFSAVSTVPAYADDTTPPPTETPTEVTPPVDESALAATEAIPVADETVPVEVTVAALLIQVPEGTELVVVNDEGETIPLASEEAAQLIEAVDPMWCPAGVNPGAAACSIGYTSLTQLVTDFNDGAGGQTAFAPSGNGVIWIQKDADPGSAGTSILMNGSIGGFISIANFSLTLKGGWNGCNPGCVNTVDVTHPSIFDQSLSIINWNGDVTLSDITFSGVTVGSASNNAALNIQTSKKITLKNVKVNNNSGAGTVNGAVLDNADADPLIFGNVSITNSKFNDNKNVGLTVNSEGTITLANVLVNKNSAGGAYLNNSFAASARAVTIVTGTNEFSDNLGGDGLNILSKGGITLKDMTANGNGGNGATVNNLNASTPQAVTLSGTNTFSDNTNFGLMVDSRGVISVSNLIANSNTNGWGAQLRNYYDPLPQAVKLTGNNEFKFNGYGLLIQTLGAITTNNVVATDNTNGRGAVLWNDDGFPSNVTMTGTNVFTDNHDTGLEIYSWGSITLNNINATGNGNLGNINDCDSSNGGCGVYLNNIGSLTPMAVTLNGTNTFNGNFRVGLEIHTNGAVVLNKITANGNGYGALIHNELAALPKAVTLTGYGVFSNNSWDGLVILTKGAITLNNVTANENHNLANTAGGNGVSLDNTASTPALPQNITLKGVNQFNGNYVSGLNVNTYGIILLNNVTAKDNSTGYGALIHNELAALPKAVTLTGYGVFNNNKQGGLFIQSNGAMTLNNVTANNNTAGRGVKLDNKASTSAFPQNVTINGINTFNGNANYGLEVDTYGAILTNNLTANDNTNGGDGVKLFNGDGTAPKTVTLNGVNVFNNNAGHGLSIESLGTITISKLEANNNVYDGARLLNYDSAVSAGINITGWAYLEDDGLGLFAHTNGNITIANFNINNCGGQIGVYLVSHGGNVTLSGASQIFDCDWIGLAISSGGGSVTLSNLTVSGNVADGVVIDTTDMGSTITGSQNVKLTGSNTFWNNGGNGLSIQAYGAITISNIDAYNNGAANSVAGVYLDNCGAYNFGACNLNLGLVPKAIMVTGSNFFEKNETDGLQVLSLGAISISNIHSEDNGGNGAYLNNQWGTGSVGGITLTGINSFENNDGSGLVALSNGAISMSNLTADSNDGDGVTLDNHSVTGATAVAVTLTGVNIFTNNGTTGTGSGLVINAGGQITLSNVTALRNQADGASLDNYTNAFFLPVKPGVKLTGLNIFNHNLANGLDIQSAGAVDLVNVTADDNGTDGVHANIYGTGTFTLACGSMNNNSGNGWDLAADGLITLKGVFGFGNTAGNFTSSIPVVSRACPPAPVVIPPVDDSEKEPHGSKRTPPVYNPNPYYKE